ncbi:MAG: S24/S26 family peptidase [Oscillospiraceae bacterium]|nr:S24/S26 family peptidase [Oscillospiraceae bacterium]
MKGIEPMQTVTIPMENLAQVLQLQLDRGGTATLTVTGSSMMPMLHSHTDTVFLVPVTASLKKKDLILYRRENGKYVLHRIVRQRSREAFICSGDNQWEPETVYAHQAIGLVNGFTRKGKRYSVEHLGYRIYVWFWVAIFPVRRPLIWMRRHLGLMLKTFKT